VGEPGIGKGLPIKQVSLFLKHWKKKDSLRLLDSGLTKEDVARAQAALDADIEKAQANEYQGNAKGSKELFEPLLFPIAADATTFEALVEAVSESITHMV